MRHNKEPESLGEKIKKRREALGFSREQTAREIQAPLKYIQALEEDSYQVFPAKIYAAGFLKKMLRTLKINEPEEILREFDREWGVRTYRKNTISPLRGVNSKSLQITPKRLSLAAGIILFLLVIVFLGLQFKNFISAPKINLQSPSDQKIFYEPLAQIQGKTEKESLLTMNGREIKIDPEGNFDEKIELTPGLNTLEFLVKNKFGKEAKEVRYVLVK